VKRFPHVPPRLTRLFWNNPVFFITVCTERRRQVLATALVHEAFARFAERAHADHDIAVGRYVIMPDHVHLFVSGPENFELGRWMGALKQCLEKQILCTRSTGPLWQRGFFDHVLRNDESYGEKWNYVRDNPVRAGLVPDADDWPYAGEIVRIDRV
jgi:putative transposase